MQIKANDLIFIAGSQGFLDLFIKYSKIEFCAVRARKLKGRLIRIIMRPKASEIGCYVFIRNRREP